MPPQLKPYLSGMDALTLKFRDPSLESEYQSMYPAGMRAITRFGLVLAVLLFMTFGFLEQPASEEMAQQMWMLRVGIILFLLLLLAASTTRFYYRHMQLLVSCAVVAMAAVYALLQALTPKPLIEESYTFILLMVGAYTVLALQFINVLVVSAFITGMFLLGIFLAGKGFSASDLGALLYVSTAMLLVVIGSYLFDRQQRSVFFAHKELEAEREESHRLALHDSLTGLANRRLLMERIEHALASDRRSGLKSLLMFLDLDEFKQVNDTMGHDAGDELLIEVGRRLQGVGREVDTVARLGGDEFVVLFEDVRSQEDAEALAHRVRAAFDEPARIHGKAVPVFASIGVAMHPGDGETSEAILQAADAAMYIAKKQKGTNFRFHAAA